MADASIVSTANVAAPEGYTLQGTNELLLKAVRATIDGSGTATAYLPALQLLDPNGNVMWTAVGSSVAAGASADVSWFPGLAGSGSGGSTAPNDSQTAYVWGVGTTMGTVPSGGGVTNMKWRHFQTTDATIFGTDTGGAASPPYHNADSDSFFYFNKNGAYIIAMTVRLTAGAYAQAADVGNVGSQWQIDHTGSTADLPEDIASNTAADGVFGQYALMSRRMFYVDNTAGPGIVTAQLHQTSGAAKSVLDFNMGVMYLGGTVANLASVY
jgi:hypothetical protein